MRAAPGAALLVQPHDRLVLPGIALLDLGEGIEGGGAGEVVGAAVGRGGDVDKSGGDQDGHHSQGPDRSGRAPDARRRIVEGHRADDGKEYPDLIVELEHGVHAVESDAELVLDVEELGAQEQDEGEGDEEQGELRRRCRRAIARRPAEQDP